MSSPDDQSHIVQITRTLQIIISTMVVGLIVFVGLAVFMAQALRPKPQAGVVPSPPIPAVVVCGITAAGLAASVFVPKVVTDAQRRSIANGTWKPPQTSQGFWSSPFGDATRLVSVYQTQKIIGAGLNEFAALFALIAYMVGGDLIVLIAALPLIVGVAARIPTQNGVERWIERQLDHLNLERQFGE